MHLPKDCLDRKELGRALFAEFVGTALFLFIGVGSVISSGEFLTQDGIDRSNTVGRIMPISMAFGMAIMVLVYGTGNLSGGHLNPAVTFFLFLINDISAMRGALYIFSQLAGATLGTCIIWGGTSTLASEDVGSPPFNLGANALNSELNAGNGLLLEMMGTFILCVTILMTAVRGGGPSDGQPNLAPLCIGFAVFLAHIVLIPFTGCGINPARTFGPFLVNSFARNDVWDTFCWIYFVGPAMGALLAAGCHWILIDSPEENEQEEDGDAKVHKYHMPENELSTGFKHDRKPKPNVIVESSASASSI